MNLSLKKDSEHFDCGVCCALPTQTYAAVSFDGILSRWFDVRQSVRQGGVLSAWLYVIFMNALPDTLENNNVGAFIGSDLYGCPMQADDVALVGLTKDDLSKMMTISYGYSRKWRYRLNPS